MRNNLLFFIPTYNEIENIEIIFSQISELKLSNDILFVDDNSPDGTGKKLDEISKKHKNVFVIKRDSKQGIGSAHKIGITWAYEKGYEKLITMDCDLSHSPKDIGGFLEKFENNAVIVGSRFHYKKSLSEWGIQRKLLSHLGNFASKIILGMNYDSTGAFRLYNTKKIPINFLKNVYSNGYSFFFESLYVLHCNGYKIEEVPINLPARTRGQSKMTIKDAITSVFFLFRCKLRSILNRKSLIVKSSSDKD